MVNFVMLRRTKERTGLFGIPQMNCLVVEIPELRSCSRETSEFTGCFIVHCTTVAVKHADEEVILVLLANSAWRERTIAIDYQATCNILVGWQVKKYV
ncbi:hypothetical protein Y1Q_0023178 [Alligator mississippiensis]|uniref:Uncharacterized protein n=1 Tax=Alligator mississippiensis TaxID=8496 RepID=A0A151MZ40_ALLMI|nr:hypothetical protein Y1Q_0023178 [Alligator mississippiensis]